MSTDGTCYVCGQKLRGDTWDAEHPQALSLGCLRRLQSRIPFEATTAHSSSPTFFFGNHERATNRVGRSPNR